MVLEEKSPLILFSVIAVILDEVTILIGPYPLKLALFYDVQDFRC